MIDAGQVAQVAQARASAAVRGRRWPRPTCRWCWARACSGCSRWPVTAAFSEDEIEILLRLARTSVGAIVNAAHFEQERGVARALTRGFVPDSPPAVDEYETAALYEPAGGRDRRRRRVRPVEAARRRPRAADRRRGRQGRRRRGQQRHDALLRRGAQLGRRRARRDAGPDRARCSTTACPPTPSSPRSWRSCATASCATPTPATCRPCSMRADGVTALVQAAGLPLGIDRRGRVRGADPDPGARRPALRLHRRPDRGPPRTARCSARTACARPWTPSAAAPGRSRTWCEAVHEAVRALGRHPRGRLHRPAPYASAD